MYLCYMDESGTPDLPGNTSHFILVGLSIPVWHWKTCDREIAQLKREHSLGDEEIHCAWMLRRYLEQSKLFVDSQLTSMVQLADICSYALRRYLENGEQDLFQLVFKRADRKDGAVVGVRHFTDYSCDCHICTSHTK